MVIFSKAWDLANRLLIHLSITIQLNICFGLSYSPYIPFTIELGLVFVTFKLELYKLIKKNE